MLRSMLLQVLLTGRMVRRWTGGVRLGVWEGVSGLVVCVFGWRVVQRPRMLLLRMLLLLLLPLLLCIIRCVRPPLPPLRQLTRVVPVSVSMLRVQRLMLLIGNSSGCCCCFLAPPAPTLAKELEQQPRAAQQKGRGLPQHGPQRLAHAGRQRQRWRHQQDARVLCGPGQAQQQDAERKQRCDLRAAAAAWRVSAVSTTDLALAVAGTRPNQPLNDQRQLTLRSSLTL